MIMKKNKWIIIGTLLLFSLFFTACRKKAWDDYYSRPEGGAKPIYSVLLEKGNFTQLLKVIDKSGYKSTLDAAGYWTFFAPDDAAFQKYLTEKGLSSVDNLSEEQCRNIVTYCLIYYAYKKERLGDFQASTGWVKNQAFKRRTANFTGVYNDTSYTGTGMKAIASNRNNNGTVFYVNNDNNYKYIPYFVDNFMNAKGLTASDYEYFYPKSTYTGFNVAEASVKEQDIIAENGVIHVIDRVIEALPSIDEYLRTQDQFSLFRNLYEKYMVSFTSNPYVTKNYQILSGGSSQVFTKLYAPSLAFSLNNENFLSPPSNDPQQGTYSIFAPTNQVLQAYIDTVLLQHYNSLDDMPPSIISDFLNAHMWQTPVWPSKFASTYNFVNEEARFDPQTNIIEKKMLSNGIFYGTNKVQDANIFSSVYGKAYLDPKYSMMIKLLNLELRSQVANIHNNYTIFMISNQLFNDAGFTVDETVSTNAADQWRFTPKPGSSLPASTGTTTKARLQRILNLHVVPNKVLRNLVSDGVAMTYGGEYLRFINNTVYAAGNVDSNNVVRISNFKEAKNGRVYYIDRILEFSEETLGQDIERLGTPTSSPYNYFWQYLKNSAALWNNTTKVINGVANGSFYTLFAPSNQAILKAVNDGFLPGTGTAPNKVPKFVTTTPLEAEQVSRFILYHFLDKRTVAPDGVESGAFPTVLKNNVGDATTVFVNNGINVLTIIDMNGRTANFIPASSNNLANRAVIHLIDNYLKFIY